MFKAIKEFFTGKPAEPVEAPYKVEAVAPVTEPVVEPVAPMPIGIEAVVATPVAEAKPAKAPAKPRAPAKPKAEKAPKVAAMKVPAVKKPRTPKAK